MREFLRDILNGLIGPAFTDSKVRECEHLPSAASEANLSPDIPTISDDFFVIHVSSIKLSSGKVLYPNDSAHPIATPVAVSQPPVAEPAAH